MTDAHVGDWCMTCQVPVDRPRDLAPHIRVRCLRCTVAALGDKALTEVQRKKGYQRPSARGHGRVPAVDRSLQPDDTAVVRDRQGRV